MATPPHRAELTLLQATEERTEEFLAAALRGFYEEYDPDVARPALGVFEPDRMFGFAVDGRWVSTCGAYSRVMTVPGGTVPVAAVTFVTVTPSYRRRGLLTAMMRHQLDDVVARGTEPVALLWASEAPIYGRFGYGAASCNLEVSGPTPGTGFRPEVELGSGSVGEVDVAEWRRAVEPLHARLLPDRPGGLNRPTPWWDAAVYDHPSRRHGQSPYRFALHHPADGAPDGYLLFRTHEPSPGHPSPGVEVRVTSLDAVGPAARARLWRFVLDLDLVRSFRAEIAADEPLRHLVADARAFTTTVADGTYARLVDVPRALQARAYAADVDVVLGVRDVVLPQNDGTFRLQAGPDGVSVDRVTREPDLRLGVRDLGSLYLGGTAPTALRDAGLVEERTPGSAAALGRALSWSRLPFCNDGF